MNFKRARIWRNLLLFSALSSAASLHSSKAEDGVSRISDGAVTRTAGPNSSPGVAGVPSAEGYVPLSASPYMPLDPGYDFNRPMPPTLPPAYETLRNSRRDAIGPRFDVGQFLNDRLGVDGGDTNFNFLLPFLVGSDHEVLFVDGRGLVSQSGRGGASAGVGYRVYDPDMDRVLGISGWVDYDDGNNRTYQQTGLSFESLGRWIDVRLNGYLPFGRDDSLDSRSFVGDPFFGSSNLLINQRTATESAFYGMDAEIGGPLPILGRYGVSGYVGGYWLDSKTDDTAVGPRVRFEANVTDSFRVNVTASNDSVFGTNAWVNFQMTLPDGRARRWFRPIPVEDKLLTTVHRDYRVHAHTRVDVAPTPVLMASGVNDGQPVSVIYVDPDRAANGTGTLESPLNRFTGFVNSPSNTLLVVDGSASSNLVRGNVTLSSDQKLVSTSILAAGGVQLDTNLGLITLPSPTGFGDATPVSPIMVSTIGGTLVTLQGNHIEVAGMTFDGRTGTAFPNSSGITGTNIVDFNIHHNTFRSYREGVVLNNATGVGLFQTNTMTGTPGTSNDGLRLTNTGVGTLDLFIDSFSAPAVTEDTPTPSLPLATTPNTIIGNDGAGIRVTARDRAQINAHIVGNFIGISEDRDGDGVLDVGEDLNGDGMLTQGNNGDGIVLDAAATGGVIRGSVVGNTINGNRGEDRNGNGLLDPGEDRDGDGLLTKGNGLVLIANAATLEMASLGEDANANGKLDLAEDLNGNGALDPSEDKNNNGTLDVSEDTNRNRVLDPGEDRNNDGVLDFAEDRNGNGMLDAGEDTNGNGLLDTNEDTNRNGKLDLSEDKNGNGVLDPSEDLNENGRLDGGYLITGNTITNNNGDGIVVNGTNNSIINLVLTQNNFGNPSDRASGNGGRGVSIHADSGIVNASIGFLSNEDVNFNGVFDTEDINGNGRLDFGEDANGNGMLDTEDTNGNLKLDIANPLDGNFFMANNGGGLLVDLSGSAFGNIVALNNVIGNGDGNLTFLIDGPTTGVPFSFANSSQRGINLTGMNWDIAPAFLEFDTALPGTNSQDFTVSNTTVTLTGLTSVNGVTMGTPVVGTDNVTYGVLDSAPLAPSTSLALRYSRFRSVNGVLDAGEDTNGNGVLDTGEDINLNGFLDAGEDANRNGRLDTFEDTNLNGFLDAGEDTNRNGRLDAFEDRPQQFAFRIDVDGTGGVPEDMVGNDFIGSTVTATFSSGHVLSGTLQAVPGNALAAQFVATSPASSLVSGPGIELRASGTAVLNAPTIVGNDIRFQGGGGLTVRATEDGQINNLLVQGNTIQSNGTTANAAGGISLATSTSTTASITGSILNNQSIGNFGPGVSLTADGGSINVLEIDGNLLNGNTNALALNTLNQGLITTRVTNNTMDNSTQDGFTATANTGSITLNQFSDNSVSNSGTDPSAPITRRNGVRWEALDGGMFTILPTEDVNGNNILDAGEDLNGNGLLDRGVAINRLSEDLNGNGSLEFGEDVNGNNRLDPSEDRNGNGILDAGEDLNGNGVLDLSEDLNGNGLLDVDEDKNGNGVLDLAVFTTQLPEDINGNDILDPGEDTNGNGRLDVPEDKNNNGVLDIEDFNGNGVLDAGEDLNGNGVLDPSEDLNGNGVLDAFPFSNTLDNNAGSGLLITGTNGIFNLGTVSGLSVNRTLTGMGGIVIDVTDSVLIGQFVGNTIISDAANTNTNPGFSLTATGTPGDLGNLFSVTVENNRIDNNSGAGVSMVLRQDASGMFAIRNNTITRTREDDFTEDANGNGVLDPNEDTNGNGTLDQGEDLDGDGILDLAEDLNGNGVLDSIATPFAGEGIIVQMIGTPVLPNARGILSDSFIEGNFIGGQLVTDGNNSHGIAIDLEEETTLRNLTIRGNLIVNNGGDGINFRRRDNVVVENVLIFQNLIDSNGEDLDGDGVLGATEDLNGNGILDGDGIHIAGFEGGGTILGFDLQENEITRNRMSGIHLHVAADARLNVNIARNLIDANGTTGTAALANFASGRGILTTENFGHSTDMREIGGEWLANTISNNAGQGIRIDGTATNIFNEIEKNLQANSLLIGGNLIDSNGLDGILVNGPGRLTIDSNTITNNGVNVGLAQGTAADPATTGNDLGNGIAIRSVLLDEFGNVADQTLPPEDMNAPGSTLELRAAGPKFVEIFRNEIRENASDGLEIRHANNPSRLHDAELHPGFFPLTVIAQNNTIETNGLRGVDILNQGGIRTPEIVDDGPPETGADTGVNPPVATIANTSNQFSPTDTTIRLLDNKIASNGKEGVYVVNTASLTQGQAGDTPVPVDPEDGTRGMLTTGSDIDAVPRLALEVHHNLIIKNGQRLDVDAAGNPIDTITASGLVIRVGTSDAEIIPAEPGLVSVQGFGDFASAPGDQATPIFGETGFRNADEILAATGANFGQLGFFHRLQPGGVVAKITNNGLNALGQRDVSSGFEGNFGADVYIESFVSGGVGSEFPSIARLDMIFEQNAGDAIDVTNFGAHFFQPRANGQRLASQLNIPGLTLPLFGRVVGVHLGNVEDLPSTPDDDASASSFFAFDAFDPLSTPLDDRAAVYDGLEIVMTAAPDTDGDDSFVATYSGLPLGNRFGLQTPLLSAPANGDPFRVELSQTTVFDVVLFGDGQDPRTDLSSTPRRGAANFATGTFLAQGAILRFIDEEGVDDLQQPVRDQQVEINNNFEDVFGHAVDTTNPNIFHVESGVIIDTISPTPRTGEGAVASNSRLAGMPGTLTGKTSNQTLEVLPGLTRAPRDGNLFVITAISAGTGPSAFRVAGATVAAQAQLGINVDTNAFTHNNLGFDDAVSLESGLPQGDELPFEWGTLPDANRTRILEIFSPLTPLPAAPPTFKDFTFRRIVFPQ